MHFKQGQDDHNESNIFIQWRPSEVAKALRLCKQYEQ